jgi:hypothetical protein
MNLISNSKRSLAVFLLLLTSVRILVVPVVYLDFELNKEYIIQNLCENRFKPELNCNGQCYLAKQLHRVAEDKATKEAERQEQGFKKLLEESFNHENFVFSQTFESVILTVQNNFSYKTSHYSTLTASLFHPPCLG